MKKIWNKLAKDLWIILLDIIAVNGAYYLALVMRFFVHGEFRPIAETKYIPGFLHFAPFYTVLCLLVFALFRLYGGMWQVAGINDMHRILGANAVTAVLQVIGTWLIWRPGGGHVRMPISYYVIGVHPQITVEGAPLAGPASKKASLFLYAHDSFLKSPEN